MATFDIKITSDPVCPWCYIGKTRLDKAIELYRKVYPGGKDDTFKISWSAFYLDPTSPEKGIPWTERATQRFGPDRLEAMKQRLTMIGKQEGIKFSFNSKIGRTRDAHRMIQFGKSKGHEAENRIVMELFHLYFEEDGDITSHDLLAQAAERAGLDKAEAMEWLSSGKGGQEVDNEVREANARGIHGVPNFLINGRYEIEGGQDPEVFLEQFTRIKARK